MASSRSANLNMRVRPRELKAWQVAAELADETLSEWIRTRLNLLATQAPLPVPPVVSGDQVELPFKNGKQRRRPFKNGKQRRRR
jgi:hypothetical protein